MAETCTAAKVSQLNGCFAPNEGIYEVKVWFIALYGLNSNKWFVVLNP